MSSPTAAQPPDDPIEELLAQCLGAVEGGAAAVTAACQAHPDLAEGLRARFAVLCAMGLDRQPETASEREPMPARLGEFELRERLGGGGMGIVYLAEQRSLGRTVALKVIRPELLFFPGARERFAREVAAVALLQHPGIVPVHTFGQEGGVPYYAMEHIAGATLAQVLARVRGRDPSALTAADAQPGVGPEAGAVPWRTFVLRLVRQVAEALEHAHARGVLHRDVKPSNIMLTATGRAMLIDFGLAHTAGQSRVTRTGYELGSLPYLSPEQIRSPGKESDERSDVYALGVTLYELLTLHNPFVAEHAETTRQRILAGQVPAPREFHRGLDWETGTVCLTAIERDPDRRYASAGDLARDLDHLLEGRPIAARSPGLLLRARRLVQRHPTASLGAALGALFAVVLPGAIAVQATQARTVEARLNTDLRAALDRDRASLLAACHAVEQLLTRVVHERLLRVPRMQELRRELLAQGIAVFEQLRATQGDAVRPAVARNAELPAHVRTLHFANARALALIADLKSLFSDRPGAESGYREAVALLEGLLAAPAAPAEAQAARAQLAQCLRNHGRLLTSFGEHEPAIAEVSRAIELFDQLLAAPGAPPELRAERVKAATVLGEALLALGRLDAARAALLAGRAVADPEASGAGATEALESGLGELVLQLGRIASARAEPMEAEALFREGLAIHEQLLRSLPEEAEWRQRAVVARANLGLALREQHREAEALVELEQTAAGWRGLMADFPSATIFRQNLGRTLHSIGVAQCQAGSGDALASWRDAVTILEPLLATAPGRPDFARDVAFALGAIGRALLVAGRCAEARDPLRRAAALVEGALAAEDLPQFRSDLGSLLNNLALAELDLGETTQAVATLERAIVHQDRALAGSPVPAEARAHRRRHQAALADALRLARRYQDAAAAAERLPDLDPDWSACRGAAGRIVECLRALDGDGTLAEDARRALGDELGRRAVALLAQARARGCPSFKELTTGGLVAALRDRPDFRALRW